MTDVLTKIREDIERALAAVAEADKVVERVTAERDAARANHLKVMHERDRAILLVQKFAESHSDLELHDPEFCDLCMQAKAVASFA